MRVNVANPAGLTFIDAAYRLLRQGLSVIPVRGGSDKHKAKVAAVRWSTYRERFATSQEIESWFQQQQFEGIAVVCGRLSQLVVLDFDDAQTYERFAARFPQLTETYTILSATRQTPHLYWRTRFTVHGMSISGGELRAEGQYVVTAPTRIADRQYNVYRDSDIYEISTHELDEVLAVLRPQQITDSTASGELRQDIVEAYREAAPQIGRNNALYRVSQQAKRSGWTVTDTIDRLTPIHSEQRASGAHKPETDDERQSEAVRTIESAFKHRIKAPITTTEGLPNSIREKLIDTQKTAITARLLDVLEAHGLQQFTEAEATKTAQQYGIGRYSVLQVINGKLAYIGEQRLLPIVIEIDMQCKATERVKKVGRPPRMYRLPDHNYLYDLLGVPRSNSDPLHTDDLSSGKRYRMALHRELIERRPGEYARGWLAARIGASVRTLQRYNRVLNVQVTPVYAHARCDWESVFKLTLSEERQRVTPGQWLEDADGKRYPALRVLAHKLLKQNAAPTYVRRLPNHYAFTPSAHDAIWRDLQADAENTHQLQVQTIQPSVAVPRRVGQSAAVVHIRECLHCGQLCFDDKLVCSTCRRKREEPLPRITFDKDGNPRFPIRFNKTLLTTKNISTLLPDDFQRSLEVEDPHHKAWLQTPDGKRYPTIQGLAFRLVKRYGEVFLVQRDVSTEMLYNLGTNLLKIGARRMGHYYLRRAGLYGQPPENGRLTAKSPRTPREGKREKN